MCVCVCVYVCATCDKVMVYGNMRNMLRGTGVRLSAFPTQIFACNMCNMLYGELYLVSSATQSGALQRCFLYFFVSYLGGLHTL